MTLPIGTRLLTLDGRKFGNAIVLSSVPDDSRLRLSHLIETDFGNRMHVSMNMIDDHWSYDLDEEPNLERWLHDRKQNINR